MIIWSYANLVRLARMAENRSPSQKARDKEIAPGETNQKKEHSAGVHCGKPGFGECNLVVKSGHKTHGISVFQFQSPSYPDAVIEEGPAHDDKGDKTRNHPDHRNDEHRGVN